MLVGAVERIAGGQGSSEPRARIRDRGPFLNRGQRIRREAVCGAGLEERARVREMPVEGEPLNARLLSDGGNRRPGRPDRLVQLHGGSHDAVPGLRLTLGPALELVLAGHGLADATTVEQTPLITEVEI